MKVLTHAVLLMAVLPLVAGAQSQEDLERALLEIGRINADAQRLEAYDMLVDTLEERIPEEVPGTEVGDWYVERDADPITDVTEVYFVLAAAEGGRRGAPPMLIIRQEGGKLDVFVSWNEYFSENSQTVTYRIDDAPPQTTRWSVSTDNSATFFPGRDIEIVQQLLDADRLVMRTTPFNDSPMTVVFDVTGLRAAAQRYQDDLREWFD